MALFAFLGGMFGFLSAQAKAFQLKLIAQKALCLVAIETNTWRTYERVLALSNAVEDAIRKTS